MDGEYELLKALGLLDDDKTEKDYDEEFGTDDDTNDDGKKHTTTIANDLSLHTDFLIFKSGLSGLTRL